MVDVSNELMLIPELAGDQIYAEVSDGIGIEKLDKKWSVNKKEILQKLKLMSVFQIACLEIFIEGFWKSDAYENMKVDEYVKKTITDPNDIL